MCGAFVIFEEFAWIRTTDSTPKLGGLGRSAVGPRRPRFERAEREREAIALRTAGHSYDEIAARVGYTDRSGARKAVERGLSRWMRDGDEDLRGLELERTEVLIGRLWPLVDRPKPDLEALTAYLRLANYRAKIAGLYAPRRQHVEVAVSGRVEHRKLEALRVLESDVEVATVIDEHVTAMLELGRVSEHDQ